MVIDPATCHRHPPVIGLFQLGHNVPNPARSLSTIKIQWGAPFKDRSFQTKLFQLLTGKYGKYAKKGKRIFYETSTWTIDKTNRVSMRTGGNAILAEYVDRIAYEQGQKESKKRQEENWRQSEDKDAGKF